MRLADAGARVMSQHVAVIGEMPNLRPLSLRSNMASLQAFGQEVRRIR